MLDELNNIKNDIQDYIEVRLDLIRLHTAENISRILSSTATLVIIGYLLFFILFFFSFALGFFLGKRFESNELGFLCVGAFYLVFLIFFIIIRKQIVEKPIIKVIVKLFFPKFNDNEN